MLTRTLAPSPALLALGGWYVASQPRSYYRPQVCPFAFTACELILVAPSGRVVAHCDPIFDPDPRLLPVGRN